MSETIRLPGVDDDTNATINRLMAELEAKKDRNLLRAAYYDGKRAIRNVGTVIPPQYYRLGIVLGWSAKAVDLLARRCNLDGFVWPDGDLDSIGFDSLWNSNMVGNEVDQAIVSSLVHGPAFAVATKGGDGEPPALIHFKDAINATGDWNPRTRSLDNLLSITCRSKQGNVSGFALYLDGLTIIAEKENGAWQAEEQAHDWGMPAELLAYKPRIGRPLGQSRITRPVMSLQDMATREVIRLEGHMDVYSYPELWMLGADQSVFKNADGTPQDRWKVMLGRIKGIPDDDDAETPRADVKQFPASSPEPHLAALNTYAKLMAREASLPDTALAVSDIVNPTSAESYDASQYELIAEAEGATDDWSPGLRRVMMKALAIANGITEIPPAWSSIAPKWRDPRYVSRASMADAGMKQLTAMPWLAETDVGLELLGLTAQQRERAESERRKARAATMLGSLTAAAGG